jgi:hypothetical protein
MSPFLPSSQTDVKIGAETTLTVLMAVGVGFIFPCPHYV